MGFRVYKTRSIYREDSGLLQIIYINKLRTNWHRVFFGCIPLFDPEAKLSFGEPGGNIRKEVSGANTDASIRSMKSTLEELIHTVIPVFEETFTVKGFREYLYNLSKRISDANIQYRLALANAKLENYEEALSILSGSIFHDNFWKNRITEFKAAIENGAIQKFLIDNEEKNRKQLKI